MASFRIQINGDRFFESEDITALTLVADEIHTREEQRISLHASSGEGSLQWLVSNLETGDKINIEIVGTQKNNEEEK